MSSLPFQVKGPVPSRSADNLREGPCLALAHRPPSVVAIGDSDQQVDPISDRPLCVSVQTALAETGIMRMGADPLPWHL